MPSSNLITVEVEEQHNISAGDVLYSLLYLAGGHNGTRFPTQPEFVHGEITNALYEFAIGEMGKVDIRNYDGWVNPFTSSYKQVKDILKKSEKIPESVRIGLIELLKPYNSSQGKEAIITAPLDAILPLSQPFYPYTNTSELRPEAVERYESSIKSKLTDSEFAAIQSIALLMKPYIESDLKFLSTKAVNGLEMD